MPLLQNSVTGDGHGCSVLLRPVARIYGARQASCRLSPPGRVWRLPPCRCFRPHKDGRKRDSPTGSTHCRSRRRKGNIRRPLSLPPQPPGCRRVGENAHELPHPVVASVWLSCRWWSQRRTPFPPMNRPGERRRWHPQGCRCCRELPGSCPAIAGAHGVENASHIAHKDVPALEPVLRSRRQGMRVCSSPAPRARDWSYSRPGFR